MYNFFKKTNRKNHHIFLRFAIQLIIWKANLNIHGNNIFLHIGDYEEKSVNKNLL